jgi:hypothetical protein
MAKNHQMTHVGMVSGSGLNTNKHPVELRETQTMWVSSNGVKYNKSTGKRSGSDNEYSTYELELGTVKPIGEIL